MGNHDHRREGKKRQQVCVQVYQQRKEGEHDQSAILLNFVTGVPISLLQDVWWPSHEST